MPNSWGNREPPSPAPPDTPDGYVTREYLDHALTEWRVQSRKYFDSKFDELSALAKSGFPNDNPARHREYHEDNMEEAKARASMRRSIIEKLIMGVVWGGALLIASAVWDAIKLGVRP